jgi:hypothetical protein
MLATWQANLQIYRGRTERRNKMITLHPFVLAVILVASFVLGGILMLMVDLVNGKLMGRKTNGKE